MKTSEATLVAVLGAGLLFVSACGSQPSAPARPSADASAPSETTSAQLVPVLNDPTGFSFSYPSSLKLETKELPEGTETTLNSAAPVSHYFGSIVFRNVPNPCEPMDSHLFVPRYQPLPNMVTISGVFFPRFISRAPTNSTEIGPFAVTYRTTVGGRCLSVNLEETYEDLDQAGVPANDRAAVQARRRLAAEELLQNFRLILQGTKLVEHGPPDVTNFTPVVGSVVDLRKLAGQTEAFVQNELGRNFEVPQPSGQYALLRKKQYNIAGGLVTVQFLQSRATQLSFTFPLPAPDAVEAARRIGFDVGASVDPNTGQPTDFWRGDFGTPMTITVHATRGAAGYTSAEVTVDPASVPR